MPLAQYSLSLISGGVAIQQALNRSGDHANSYEVALPAGKAVTAWVKTDANTAACDLPSGHGYTNGNFDVYWATGVRYGVPGTIATNALSLDGGAGDDFPASGELNMVVCKQVTINAAIDGDAIQVIGIVAEFADPASTAAAHIDFQDASDASIVALELTANAAQLWDVAGGASNVFAGDPIVVAYASNGSSADAAILKIASMEDSTP